MRELTPVEMRNVSGAGFFDFIGSVVVGAAAGITAFGVKWAMSGGSAGGVLGVGLVSGAGGLVIGAVVGLVDGALYGAMNGWDTTAGWFNEIVENTFDPTAPVITA
ncbi:hypothetical protein WKH27_15670 [Pantoea agglomerans]|uniref:Colicin V synthesis protein n=1 Tax=Enterobacter agglomerans TaxID=549 RepID=A0ABD6XL02_ENTAG|nr:hypothetical protein [Pantoea agglomerans]WNK37837.1 hypothetical protein RM158_23275 [Pantoea agglomerans]WNK56010.1 hypothetical protein RM154_22805 [Pantoea agglomerans]WNK73969.1 hypothetical protein RM155_22720 [Pantoea agglomerans]